MARPPELRPHFGLFVALGVEDTVEQLRLRFAELRGDWNAHLTGTFAQLVAPRRQRRVWSPWLSFTVREHPEGSLLVGFFAPHPSVWTMYIAGYAILAFLLLGLGFFGLSQWLAGEAPTMLWSVPICLALAAILYLSAFLGQSLTASQMREMRELIQASFAGVQTHWVDVDTSEEASGLLEGSTKELLHSGP
ncbi:MAG: hypothetical protein HC923_06115 [Myxococcales bacterium]|nr:hypothetical protein [Myxococcales bacterium]